MTEKQQISKHSVASVGLDWLTFVTVEGEATKTLIPLAKNLMQELNGTLLEPSHWKGLGYEGWALDEVKCGTRGKDEGIVIISGQNAASGLVLCELVSGRVTRLDLQVTIALDRENRNVARETFEALESTNKHRKKPYNIKLIQSNTGDTIYVGKRSSKVYLRLYDKTHSYNSGHTGQYWRYEVEYKGVAARKALETINKASDMTGVMMGLVFAEYQKRQVVPRFRRGSKISVIEVGASVTTPESKLKWLEKCVAPVVTQLCLIGYEREVLNSLRLRDVIVNIRGE